MTGGENGESKGRESSQASNLFLMCSPQLYCSELIMELYGEEKEEGDRIGQEDKKGE